MVAEEHVLSHSDSPHSVASVWHMVHTQSLSGLSNNGCVSSLYALGFL